MAQGDTPDSQQDHSVAFMLAEMNLLSEFRRISDETAEGRLNMLITVASISGGALLILAQLETSLEGLVTVLMVASALIWLLGLMTYRRLLGRVLVVTRYLRALNRIRRYFVDQDRRIETNLSLPITDSLPSHVALGGSRYGARAFSTLIASVACGLFWAAVPLLTMKGTQATVVAILFGVAAFGASALVLELIATTRLKAAEEQYDVRFPHGEADSAVVREDGASDEA